MEIASKSKHDPEETRKQWLPNSQYHMAETELSVSLGIKPLVLSSGSIGRRGGHVQVSIQLKSEKCQGPTEFSWP